MLQRVPKLSDGPHPTGGRKVSRLERETLVVGAGCWAVMAILLFPTAATRAAPLVDGEHRNRCLPPFCYEDPTFVTLGAVTETAQWNLLDETSIDIELPPIEYLSHSTLESAPPGDNGDDQWAFGNYTYDYGDCPLSELVYDVTPTGIEASYPEETTDGCLQPRVWIPFEGTFRVLGFRVVVPSKHTLGGTDFAAELQIVHERVDDDDVWNREHSIRDDDVFDTYKFGKVASCSTDPTPFFVLSVVIDSNSNSPEGSEALEEVLVEWQTTLELHKASCHSPAGDGSSAASDPSTDAETAAPSDLDAAAPNTDPLIVVASAIMDRGNNANFVDGPIRRRASNTGSRTPYDLFVPLVVDDAGTSYYVYGTGTSECTEVVLWNLAEEPLEIPQDQLAKMMALVLGYNDANCSATPMDATIGSPWSETMAVQTRNPSMVGPSNKISWILDWCLEHRMGSECTGTQPSESTPRLPLGMVMAILAASIATLVL